MKLKQNPKERVLDGLAFVIVSVVRILVILGIFAFCAAVIAYLIFIYTHNPLSRAALNILLFVLVCAAGVRVFAWADNRLYARAEAVQEGATDESA